MNHAGLKTAIVVAPSFLYPLFCINYSSLKWVLSKFLSESASRANVVERWTLTTPVKEDAATDIMASLSTNTPLKVKSQKQKKNTEKNYYLYIKTRTQKAFHYPTFKIQH